MQKQEREVVEINNPGGGDCAFYAFALGLMPYLKMECKNAAPEQRPLLTKAISFLKDNQGFFEHIGVDVENFIKTFFVLVNRFDYFNPDIKFLKVLVLVLRGISFLELKREIEISLSKENWDGVRENAVLCDINDCFESLFTEVSPSSDFTRDEDFRKLAKTHARVMLSHPQNAEAKEPSQQQKLEFVWAATGYRPTQAKQPFELPQNSQVFRILSKKLSMKTWGTEQDLNALGAFFKIEVQQEYIFGIKGVMQGFLNTIKATPTAPASKVINSEAKQEDVALPLIRVKCYCNWHWTTELELPFVKANMHALPDACLKLQHMVGKLFELFQKKDMLGVEEIIQVLVYCLPPKLFSFWPFVDRAYEQLVNVLINICKLDKPINDIVEQLKEKIIEAQEKKLIDSNSKLFACFLYIMLRYEANRIPHKPLIAAPPITQSTARI